MKRLFASVVLGALLVLPLGARVVPTALAARTMRNGPCPPPAKAYKCQPPAVITTVGTFQVRLASSPVTLQGTATRSALGTQIYLAKVAASRVPTHGVAFKVFASRHTPALHLTRKGSLFQLATSTGKWTAIKAITGTGIYAAVLK